MKRTSPVFLTALSTVILPTVLVALVALTPISQAQTLSGRDGDGNGQASWSGHPHRGMFDHDNLELRMERMAGRLELTKEQRAAVRTVFDKARPQTRELSDRMSDTRKQLHSLAEKETLDAGMLRQLAEAQGKIIAEKIVLRFQTMAEVLKILTPTQREKLQQKPQHPGDHSHAALAKPAP